MNLVDEYILKRFSDQNCYKTEIFGEFWQNNVRTKHIMAKIAQINEQKNSENFRSKNGTFVATAEKVINRYRYWI